MKHLLLALALLAGTTTAPWAQPVIGPAYYSRLNNEFKSVPTTDTTALATVATGPGQTWNYQGLQTRPGTQVYIIRPDNGAVSSYFPTATAVQAYITQPSPAEFYLENRPDGMYMLGLRFDLQVTKCGTGELLIPAGLLFGQTRTQAYLGRQIELGRTDTVFTDTRQQLTYTGYGTLQLPGGNTYNEVIQLKFKIENHSGLTPGGPFSYSDSTVGYWWFAPGIGHPLVEFGRGYSAAFPPGAYLNYLSDVVLNTRPPLAHEQARLFPQPAAGQVTAQLPAGEVALSARVFGITGSAAMELPVHLSRMDVSALPPGLYTLEIQGRRRTYRTRLVKE